MRNRQQRDESFRPWLQNNIICQFPQFKTSVRVIDLEELITLKLDVHIRSNRYLVTILQSKYPSLFGQVANFYSNVACFQHLHL